MASLSIIRGKGGRDVGLSARLNFVYQSENS